jgi:two-component system chemotaxis response regulator CheY
MAKGLAALRLLVVDDNAQMRTIVGSVLRAAGVRRIHYAPDGRAGLEAVGDFKPDVCFVDYEMPRVNGLDFVTTVRARSGPERYLPIIILTGHSDMARMRLARDRGVTEFLCKPVTARTILTRLETVIFNPRPFVETAGYFGPDRRRRRDEHHAGPLRRASDKAAEPA